MTEEKDLRLLRMDLGLEEEERQKLSLVVDEGKENEKILACNRLTIISYPLSERQ